LERVGVQMSRHLARKKNGVVMFKVGSLLAIETTTI
jgi:hypothetical protein